MPELNDAVSRHWQRQYWHGVAAVASARDDRSVLEPDAETLAAATRGDPAAVSDLLERYLPGLRAFVRLRAGDVVHGREEHSDIVQSACRDVLENLEWDPLESTCRHASLSIL